MMGAPNSQAWAQRHAEGRRLVRWSRWFVWIVAGVVTLGYALGALERSC